MHVTMLRWTIVALVALLAVLGLSLLVRPECERWPQGCKNPYEPTQGLMMRDINGGCTRASFIAKYGPADVEAYPRSKDPKVMHFSKGGLDVKVGTDGKLQVVMVYLPM
jgi:hypothetical protein